MLVDPSSQIIDRIHDAIADTDRSGRTTTIPEPAKCRRAKTKGSGSLRFGQEKGGGRILLARHSGLREEVDPLSMRCPARHHPHHSDAGSEHSGAWSDHDGNGRAPMDFSGPLGGPPQQDAELQSASQRSQTGDL